MVYRAQSDASRRASNKYYHTHKKYYDNYYIVNKEKINIKSRIWAKENRKYATDKMREFRRKKKEKFLLELGKFCRDCNGIFPDCVYDFHHINPEEKDKSSIRLFHLCDEKIRIEIAKCVLLCSNCHRIRHFILKEESLKNND